mgnify:CR=1 FL=1
MPPDEQITPWPSIARGVEQPRAAAGSQQHQQRPRRAKRPIAPHRRQGDRGCDDDADAEADAGRRLPVYVRYRDLVAAGIAQNWPGMIRLIEQAGLPEGIWLGRNTRAWALDEVEAWLAARPSARKVPVPPRKPQRKRQEAGAEQTTA